MPEALYPNRLTDAELLGARLHVADPRAAFDLLPHVPDAARMAGIVASYEHRPDKLRCARPGCGTPHYKGFVVQLDTGEHIIIGHVCGKAVFETDWDKLEEEHRHLRERQRLLERKQTFLKTHAEVIRTLRSWRFMASAVQDARRALADFVPELFAALRERATRGSTALTITVKLDRQTVEAMREAQAAAGGRGARQSNEREETVHLLRGADFFGATSLRDLVERALSGLDDAAARLGTADLSNHAMQRALRQAVSAAGDLRHVARLHAAAREALSNENLAGLVEWWNRSQNENALSFRHDALTVTRRYEKPHELRVPQMPPLDDSALIRLES